MNSPLEVSADFSERLHYNLSGFPLYVKKDKLSRYGYEGLCHWDPDLEFIYIIDGAMDYFINGNRIPIRQGQGIFVNSRRPHYGFSRQKEECTFIALVVHPSLFTNSFDKARIFAEQKFGFANVDYILLDSHISWQKKMIEGIDRIYREINAASFNPLRMLAEAVSICADAGEHIETVESSEKHNVTQMAFPKQKLPVIPAVCPDVTGCVSDKIPAVEKRRIAAGYRAFCFRDCVAVRLSEPQLLH